MHRLFVALRPPSAMRARLLSLMGGVPAARWQRDEQLHLTLRFVGEADRHRAADIAAALGTIHFPRFALTLDRTGTFDRRGRIDSLWAGVTPGDEVARLHRKVTQALTRVGVPPDERAYLPHLTIARFGRGSAPMQVPTSPIVSDTYEMREFCLYESVLGHAGATYLVAERYALA